MPIYDYLITFFSFLKQKEKRKLIKHAIHFRKQEGIEIGGPSDFFKIRGTLPIYIFAAKVDGVNFNSTTLWESSLQEGLYYHYYKNKTGYQYIAEASKLDFIEPNKYDFVLSCHSLEHIANPLNAAWLPHLKSSTKKCPCSNCFW